MQNLWQDGAALGVVVVAAIYLVQRMWFTRSSSGSGCAGSCEGCSTTADVSDASHARGSNSEIIPIEQLLKNARTTDKVVAEQVEVKE